MEHSKVLTKFPKMKYFCDLHHCTCVFDNIEDYQFHKFNGNHVVKSMRVKAYEIMESITYSSDTAFCPQLVKDYVPNINKKINKEKFDNFFHQGFAFEQLNRNNNKFNDRTRNWLINEFHKWQKFDVSTQKWKGTNVYSGYTDLMESFRSHFPKAEDQLTEKQIKSFFSRMRNKVKVAANEQRTQNFINEKVQEELMKELLKLKHTFSSDDLIKDPSRQSTNMSLDSTSMMNLDSPSFNIPGDTRNVGDASDLRDRPRSRSRSYSR